MTPKEIAEAIRGLNLIELMHLRELLGADFDGLEGVGVREPRKPKPESPGDAIAVEHLEGQ